MLKKVIGVILVLVAFIFFNNTSLLVKHVDKKPFLLAHRGLAQTFSMEGITAETNTALHIHKPEHPYLENTIPSMVAAFQAGADMVEFDIQLTKDAQFAVFHDATLDYRTEGKGSTRDYTMAELKRLDVGYGYSTDGGKTFPFRGKGIGMMPSLDEVFAQFPESSFLIHIKRNDPHEGELLAQYLKNLPASRLDQLAVYGGDKPIAELKRNLPNIRVMSKALTKKALISYLLVGWTGYMPASLHHTFLYLPEKYARLLWGWPHRFLHRMEKVNSQFVLVAGNGEWSEGFDTLESLKQIPRNYTGGIWTERIDRIAPIFLKKSEQ